MSELHDKHRLPVQHAQNAEPFGGGQGVTLFDDLVIVLLTKNGVGIPHKGQVRFVVIHGAPL